MNRFSRLTVRAKLTACFALVAAIAAIIGGVGVLSMQRTGALTEQMQNVDMPGLYVTGRVDSEYKAAGRSLRDVLLASDARARQEAVTRLEKNFADVQQIARELPKYFVSEERLAMIERLTAALAAYQAGSRAAIEKASESTFSARDQAFQMLVRDVKPHGDTAEGIIANLLDAKRANARALSAEIDELELTTFIVTASITVLGVLLAILLGLLLARSILRQLGGEPSDVVAIASSIAKGDLTVHIDTEKVGANSVLANMAAMQASLRRLVGSVRTSSQSIASGASQIAAGNTDLSQRTEEQAANLTQTASAMEELSGTVQSNADVARQAAQRAMAASRSAENGGEVVNNVVQTMAGITESSKRIVDIISVIDSIAFQTNILALNAAVEAARAGEQGRGFAVVASEVRSLAQKSAAAAKDIKLLIDDSVQKVEDGSRLVDTAGETMEGIVSDVKQVTDLISEISAATSEQTSGISQINDAVLQLSDVTQQNAALVEQSAAASGSLNEQARRLVELVATFKLESGQSTGGSAQSASAGAAQPKVISVPPATIEEGARRTERPAAASARGNAAANPTRGNGAANPARGGAKVGIAPATPAKAPRPAPALMGAKPALATAGVTAAAGMATYGSGVSKEDDWEEF